MKKVITILYENLFAIISGYMLCESIVNHDNILGLFFLLSSLIIIGIHSILKNIRKITKRNSYTLFEEELDIEKILLEAGSYSRRTEVYNEAEGIRKKYPSISKLNSYQLAYDMYIE
jgi:hypothetical protein